MAQSLIRSLFAKQATDSALWRSINRMGNEQSMSVDDDLSSDNNLRRYDPYIEGYDFHAVATLHDEEEVIKASRSNVHSVHLNQQPGNTLHLPPRRHHIRKVTDSTPSSRVKALVDNESVYTHTPSVSTGSYDGTEDDNSLVSYDDDEGTMEDTSGTTGTNFSTRGGAQQSLYDTDDVTAMTDMAHDGDDEATTASVDEEEEERPRQKMSEKEERRRARWKEMRRKMKDRSSSNASVTDDEETIVIIDADEEYSRSATLDEQDVSLGNPTGPTVEECCNPGPSIKEDRPHLANALEQLNYDGSHETPDYNEPSDKENTTEDIVRQVVEQAAREMAKGRFQSRKEGEDLLPKGSVTFSTHSKSDTPSMGAILEKELLVGTTTIPSSRQPDAASSTGSKSRKHRAKARIIVRAVEVTPRKKSTHHMKVVVASDVDTTPRRKLGGISGVGAAESDVVRSIPVVQIRESSDVVSRAESEVVSRKTASTATSKKAMPVVVALDVKVSPKNTSVPKLSAAERNAILHSKPMDPKPNSLVREAMDNSTAPASVRSKRDVPVVMNGKVVGTSSGWMAQKPSPESPKRQVCRDEQSVRRPPVFASKLCVINEAISAQQQFTCEQVFPVSTATDVDISSVPSSLPPIQGAQSVGHLPSTDTKVSFQATIKEIEKTTASKDVLAVDTYDSVEKHKQSTSATEQDPPTKASNTIALEDKMPIIPDLKSSAKTETKTFKAETTETLSAPRYLENPTQTADVATKEKNDEARGTGNVNEPFHGTVEHTSSTSKLSIRERGVILDFPYHPIESEQNAISSVNANAKKSSEETEMTTASSKKVTLPVQTKAQLGVAVDPDSFSLNNSTERKVARAIDVLSLDISEIEQVTALGLGEAKTGKKKVASPKPEDARGTLKRNLDSAPPAPQLTCIGSGDDDLRLPMSDDYDDGIDLDLVANYYKAFNCILEKHPEFAAQDSKMVEMIRVAKLQRILSVTMEVESELESYVNSLAVQKTETTSHYHHKLLDASRKRASREISLKKTLHDAQRDNRLLESQMTWQLVTMCHVNARQFDVLRHNASQQPFVAYNPLAGLPDDMATTLRDDIQTVIRNEASSPLSSSTQEQVDSIRQLELSNALLGVQVSLLEGKLIHLQTSLQRHDWVESVFRRMSTSQRLELKKLYDESLEFTL